MRLENWCYISTLGRGYLAPECQTICLVGEVYNRGGRFHDGKAIRTSEVVSVFTDDEGNYAARTFSGSIYELGKPAGSLTMGEFVTDFEKIRNMRQRSGSPLVVMQ